MAHCLVALFLVLARSSVAAYSIESVKVGHFLSVGGTSSDSGADVHLRSSLRKTERQPELLSEGSCHDAVLGEACYEDTMWAKSHAINTRPHWYPGLTNESSFADFQAHLHYCYWNRCPMPCASTSQHKCEMVGRFWSNANCQDATQGSKCHREVTWAMEHGIYLYPEWYPSVTEQSSFREFQARLFRGQQSGLEHNDCPEPCCHDALPGERCHEDASWAMLYGVNLPEINHAYPPSLTNQSAFAEFQAYLHLCYPDRCPEPCASTEIMTSPHDAGVDCHDTHKS
mmetsp:Transcript_105810/g.264943  ORF Transcript_105810/g.264943 Transcript_105810/m.264943 type:complete len:285 (+) Transcript_105810:103-957(+)